MTVKEYIKEKGWCAECDVPSTCRWMSAQIAFQNPETTGFDETEFDIKAYDENELSELFKTLCKETFGEEWKEAYSSVTAVVIVQFANTLEELAQKQAAQAAFSYIFSFILILQVKEKWRKMI